MSARYDIVVVGAGIHGAGVAQAAAAMGYKVLVLEKSDIAAGTSSKSSKLIHGGLRYLESFQFSLVRECLRERALLLKLAPDLVRLTSFYIPLYRETRRKAWQIRTGLIVYGMLSGDYEAGSFEELSDVYWDKLDSLNRRNLMHVFRYHDAQTDDRALTAAVAASAQELGAQMELGAELTRVDLTESDAYVFYRKQGRDESLSCRVLVNAAGPWANEVLQKVAPSQNALEVSLVQGTHIIVDRPLFQGVYYLEAPADRRAVFAIPWNGMTMIGTTESNYQGSADDVQPLVSEEQYLLETYNHYFSLNPLSDGDILGRFAGLRVLPGGGGKAFRKKRETIYHVDRQDKPRLLTIYGGKLTAYRATAEQVMRRLRGSLPASKNPISTSDIPLYPQD